MGRPTSIPGKADASRKQSSCPHCNSTESTEKKVEIYQVYIAIGCSRNGRKLGTVCHDSCSAFARAGPFSADLDLPQLPFEDLLGDLFLATCSAAFHCPRDDAFLSRSGGGAFEHHRPVDRKDSQGDAFA